MSENRCQEMLSGWTVFHLIYAEAYVRPTHKRILNFRNAEEFTLVSEFRLCTDPVITCRGIGRDPVWRCAQGGGSDREQADCSQPAGLAFFTGAVSLENVYHSHDFLVWRAADTEKPDAEPQVFLGSEMGDQFWRV